MPVALTSKHVVPTATENLLVAVLIGGLVGLAAGYLLSWTVAPLVAWDSLVFAFVYSTWRRVLQFDPDLTAKHATREDPSRVTADAILLIASVASLAAVGTLLISSREATAAAQVGLAALGVISVIASWAMVHTVYALRYAELYYSDPEGGIDFGSGKPVYADFAYVAFTLGMTFQVSDTALKTRALRAAALKHALLSYLLGTVIIATTINLVAGLGK